MWENMDFNEEDKDDKYHHMCHTKCDRQRLKRTTMPSILNYSINEKIKET